ncbi:hypothetical protein F3Y22_tig00015498pilonHSYRG00099 [Hibiscus syriacus]|uniref:Uncharacterized protein n=1 Tax=Hibiscus syriacus TaxID=106335 RepID=A0A6A3BY43_HIBSY|nr:hypothetical protein F3Y22_tig00015498pilonHSYRG00099 [Hibiscus syriacus]
MPPCKNGRNKITNEKKIRQKKEAPHRSQQYNPSSQPSSQSSSSSTTLIQPQIKSSLKSIPPNSILTATGSTVNVNKDNDKENRKSSNSKANPSSKLSTPSESPFISGNFDGMGSPFYLGFD